MPDAMLQPELEAMSRDALSALQLSRLRDTVRRAYENNAGHRERFGRAGARPEDVRDLSDLAKLPTMDKEVFRLSYPSGLLC